MREFLGVGQQWAWQRAVLSSATPKILRLLSLAYRVGDTFRNRRSNAHAAVEQRSAFYDQIWRQAAAELRASTKELGDGILEFERDGKRARVCANCTPIDNPVTLMLAGNKILVHRLMAERGLPVPRHAAFTLNSLEAAEEFHERVTRNCVIKPARNTGAGAGVTTGIANRAQLYRAAARAATFGREFLIEEQVPGDNFRLLYLNGKFLDAVVRRPPRVIGDGRTNVRDLVEALNNERLRGGHEVAQVLISIDREMTHTLGKQRLTLRSVPANGQEVVIKAVVNDNAGSENETATHLLSRQVIDAGASAARAVGAGLAGVDIITSDPSRPLSEAGGVILEVNTSPGFYIHYRKKGAPFPVAPIVLAALFGIELSKASDPSPYDSITSECFHKAQASRAEARPSLA